MHSDIKREELLISQLSDLLVNDKHVAVGAASPIPGAAALLAKEEAKLVNKRLRVTILHSNKYNNFTDGARELFDCAAQGRIDTFFLGGVQIDGQANINLVGTGSYPKIEKRFPGSFGSALMYFVVPQIILFREEHSPRTLVNQVDFVSAPGVSDENIYRPGGPKYLLTNRALFKFNKDLKKFSLLKLNQNQTIQDIKELTGFKFDISKNISDMLDPDTLRLKILRDKIAPMVSEFYPEFTNRIWGI
ncbi:MAG: CoA-transferase [Alphaproteobacteria bacterium]|nr:CoA-transferase [Alphaproteobacteria bacterium]MDG1882471.1 CoA-transferase [Alphaproteobacteria bacterium]MDG2458521.1 CoA-transferase [Alphaproteobacteria bacterium]